MVDFSHSLIELGSKATYESTTVVKATLNSIDSENNTGDVTLLTTCEGVAVTSVPFFYHCEYSDGSAEDLADGHKAFAEDDVVYLLYISSEDLTYIVGHADIADVTVCAAAGELIVVKIYLQYDWAGGTDFTKTLITVFDPSTGAVWTGDSSAPSFPCISNGPDAISSTDYNYLIDNYNVSDSVVLGAGSDWLGGGVDVTNKTDYPWTHLVVNELTGSWGSMITGPGNIPFHFGKFYFNRTSTEAPLCGWTAYNERNNYTRYYLPADGVTSYFENRVGKDLQTKGLYTGSKTWDTSNWYKKYRDYQGYNGGEVGGEGIDGPEAGYPAVGHAWYGVSTIEYGVGSEHQADTMTFLATGTETLYHYAPWLSSTVYSIGVTIDTPFLVVSDTLSGSGTQWVPEDHEPGWVSDDDCATFYDSDHGDTWTLSKLGYIDGSYSKNMVWAYPPWDTSVEPDSFYFQIFADRSGTHYYYAPAHATDFIPTISSGYTSYSGRKRPILASASLWPGEDSVYCVAAAFGFQETQVRPDGSTAYTYSLDSYVQGSSSKIITWASMDGGAGKVLADIEMSDLDTIAGPDQTAFASAVDALVELAVEKVQDDWVTAVSESTTHSNFFFGWYALIDSKVEVFGITSE